MGVQYLTIEHLEIDQNIQEKKNIKIITNNMKTLQEYLIESTNVFEDDESKTVTFDFTDLENAEETINSLKDKEGVSVDDNKVTITITSDNVDNLGSVQDILQQYCSTIRNSSKRSSNEQYAQKTKSFEESVGKMNDIIDEIQNPEDDDDDKDDDE